MKLFKILGHKAGLWRLAFLTGEDGKVLLCIIRRNVFDEDYCVIDSFMNWTVRLLPGGSTTGGHSVERWMHYDIADRLAEAVVGALSELGSDKGKN